MQQQQAKLYVTENDFKPSNPMIVNQKSIFGANQPKEIFIQNMPSQDTQSLTIQKDEPKVSNRFGRGPEPPLPKTRRVIQNDVFTNHKLINSFRTVTTENVGNIQRVDSISKNQFFNAFYLAYALHGEIVLSPDDIWFQISSQFSEYFNDNAEELRKRTVDHEGKMQLVVVDVTQSGSIEDKSFRWDYFLEEFSKGIKENTKGNLKDVIESNFSTTGIIEKLASQVVLMHSVEKYFEYIMMLCGCGITKVHMMGERNDWVKIIEKTQQLKKYALNDQEGQYFLNWIDRVLVNLNQFLGTFDGSVGKDYWNKVFDKNLYKAGPSGMGRGPLYGFTGWIKDFFLYKGVKGKSGQSYKEGQKPERDISSLSTEYSIDFKEIEALEIKTPVRCIDMRNMKPVEHQLHYLAGMTGVLVQDDKIYRPEVTLGFSYQQQ